MGVFLFSVAGIPWTNGFALPSALVEGVLPCGVRLRGCEKSNGPRAAQLLPRRRVLSARMARVCVVLWQLIQDLQGGKKQPILKSTKRHKYFHNKNIRSSSPSL